MSPSPTPFVVPPEDHQRALDAGTKDISPLKRFVYRSIEVLLYQQDGHYFYALIVPSPAKIRDKIKNYPSQMMLPNGAEIPDSTNTYPSYISLQDAKLHAYQGVDKYLQSPDQFTVEGQEN